MKRLRNPELHRDEALEGPRGSLPISKRHYEEHGVRLLTEMRGRSLRDSGHKVKQGRFVLRRDVLVCDDPSKKGTRAL